MKRISTITVSCLLMITLTLSGVAFAHGIEKHGKTAAVDAQMKNMHDMMPMFSLASAALEAALEKGDVTVAETEAEKIIAVIPDLKKSKPHKNIKQRKKFVEHATSFEEAVASTLDLARKGDFAGAKTAFKNTEKSCAACHTKFRN